MKLIAKLSALAIVALSSAAIAHADAFDFSYTGTGVQASGVITTDNTLNSMGGFDITGITGERNNVAISGLVPPSGTVTNSTAENGYYVIYDNVYYNPAPYFDTSGLFYSTTAGTEANLFYENGTYQEFVLGNTTSTDVSLSLTPVPEPNTLLLMGTGLFGLAGALFLSKHASV